MPDLPAIDWCRSGIQKRAHRKPGKIFPSEFSASVPDIYKSGNWLAKANAPVLSTAPEYGGSRLDALENTKIAVPES